MSSLTGFAGACYDENSIAELEEALKLRAADKTDCENWTITPTQWRAAIVEALAAKREAAGLPPETKKSGRPTLPPGEARTGRLSMRTFPDIEAKAKRVGTEAIEAAIRRIKEPAR